MYCRYLVNSTQIDSPFYIFIYILRKKSQNISRSTYNVFEPFKAFSNGSLHLLFNWVNLIASYSSFPTWFRIAETPAPWRRTIPVWNAFAFLYLHGLWSGNRLSNQRLNRRCNLSPQLRLGNGFHTRLRQALQLLAPFLSWWDMTDS